MPITRAIVLAAGLGTRLRPLTLTTPKPLLPVRGKPLLDHILRAVAAVGVHDVLLNLHHLPEHIRTHVDTGAQFGLRARFSYEPEILGTGGGIKAGAEFFGADPFFVINGDIFSDIDLSALAARHAKTADAVATLVVRELSPGETHTSLQLNADGTLQALGFGVHHYAGVMIGTPALIDMLPAGVSCVVRQGIVPLIAHGKKIATYLHTGMWNDIGTPDAYAAVK